MTSRLLKRSISRRQGLQAALCLAVPGATAQASNANPAASGPVLVAFMSRSGNTRVIAGQIQRAQGASLFEIQAAQPYPEDYQQTVDQARRETEVGHQPPLKELVSAPTLAACRTLFLGFPIWGMTVPPPMRTFLLQHDLAGKTVTPFITHGGYGLGNSLETLNRLAPAARIQAPFTLKADQERETLQQVTQWLGRTPVP